MKNKIIELTERLVKLEQAFTDHRNNANENIVKLYDMIQNNDNVIISLLERIKDCETTQTSQTDTYDFAGFQVPIRKPSLD